jgi:uncharacterized protein YbaR (Trm112 family)
MHILLTDLLACPRCGPRFGLILLADQLENRQVIEGRLGCPNCRESYPIAKGVADLRHPLAPALPVLGALRPDPERAFRTAALMGVTEANATVLVIAPTLELPASISELLPAVHLVATSPLSALPPAPETEVVSLTTAGERLPFRDRSMRGVALLGVLSPHLLEEAARVLATEGRLVIEPAPEEVSAVLTEAGFQVYLEQGGVVVAGHQGRA